MSMSCEKQTRYKKLIIRPCRDASRTSLATVRHPEGLRRDRSYFPLSTYTLQVAIPIRVAIVCGSYLEVDHFLLLMETRGGSIGFHQP